MPALHRAHVQHRLRHQAGLASCLRPALTHRSHANLPTVCAPTACHHPRARAGGGGPTVRKYLDSTVVPVLRQGLKELVRQKPEDPYTFLANFILDNRPR